VGALTLTMTGTGTVGDIAPGWSVIEDATAVVATDESASAGSGAMGAPKNLTSKYMVDNSAVLTHDRLGTARGYIGDTTEAKTGMGFAFTTLLSLLSVDRTAPPIGNSALSAVFTAYVGLVTDQITVSWQASSDPQVTFQGWRGNVWRMLNKLCAAKRVEIAMLDNVMVVRDLGSQALDITDEAAISIQRSTLSTARKINVCWYNQKLVPSLGTTLYNYSQNPSLESNATGWDGVVSGGGSSKGRQTGGGQVGAAWYRTVQTQVALVSQNPLGDDLYMLQSNANHSIDVTALLDGLSYTASVYGYVNGSFSGVVLPSFTTRRMYLQMVWVNAGGGVVGVPTTSGYVNSPASAWPGTRVSVSGIKPVGAVKLVMNLWQETRVAIHRAGLPNPAAPTGTQTSGADAVMLSESLIDYFDGSNGGSWAGTVNNSVSTKPIPLENDFYNALSDDNTIYEVSTGQVKNFVIQTANYPTALGQPTYAVSNIVVNVGEYIVSGSDGLPITASAWRAYGGSVSVAIGDIPGTIELMLTGPVTDIPGAPGPYSLSVGDGQNEFATLRIAGIGVVTSRQALDFRTGARPETTTNEYGPAIDIPFCSTKAQAAYLAVWACTEAAGPTATATVTVETELLTGFGITPGSLVVWDECVYRIASVMLGRVTSTLTLRWHTTLGAFDAPWIGRAIGDFDTLWSGYSAGDIQIAPMRSA